MEKTRVTVCCICNDMFTDPRKLPCFHNFCLKCLQETESEREVKGGDTVPCPLCRKQFVIPEGGMTGLQKNLFIQRLIKIQTISTPTTNVPLCEKCTETAEGAAEILSAAVYCIQCHQNICERCCREHKRYEELRKHQFSVLGNEITDEIIRNFTTNHCDQHVNKEYEMYCKECDQVICMKCRMGKHQKHKCIDVEQVTTSFREQITDDAHRLSDCSLKADVISDKLEKERRDFLQKINETEIAIVKRAKALKELIDEHSRSSHDELVSIKQKILNEMDSAKEDNELSKATVRSFKGYCNALKCKGTDLEICYEVKDLHTRTKELEELHRNERQRPILSCHVSFEAPPLDDLVANENFFGRVKDVKEYHRDAEPTENESDKVIDSREYFSMSYRLIQTLELQSKPVVYGVTTMQDIYVLCRSPNSVLVFDARNSYVLTKRIEIEEIQSPYDVTCCDRSNCLFISDRINRCIWKITADDLQVTKWLCDIGNPFTLSMSTDGHLLVPSEGQSTGRFAIYNAEDGKVIRSIQLPNDINKPLHVIEKPDGNFIVSHYSVRDKLWIISQVNSNGEVISRYLPTDASCYMNTPCHMAIGRRNTLLASLRFNIELYVADQQNDRVVVFHSDTFDHGRILLTNKWNGTSKPFRVCYNETKEQLIVGQGGGKVDIYERK